MADMIKFYKGALANLPAAGASGALYITSDEGAIYLGTGVGMKRLGDFVQVDAVANLPASANTSALYYCVAENVLAKWTGTEWKQVNKQPTKDELKVMLGLDAEGDVTAAIAAAKKAGDDAQADVDTLTNYVGTFTHDTAKTVVEYINAKTDGIATSGNLEALAGRVTAVEGDVATIKGDYLKAADKTALEGKITTAQTAADNAQSDVDALAQTHATDKATLEGAIALKANTADVYSQSVIDGKVATLENADKAINDKIGAVAEGKTVVGLIGDAMAAAEAAQSTADAAYVKPESGIGTSDLHADVVASLEKADTALQAADIEGKADKATTLAGYGITDAYTKGEVDEAVGAKVAQSEYDAKMEALDTEDERIAGLVSDEATTRADADTALDERLVKVEAFFEGAAKDGEGLQNALDTLVEIQDYVNTHGEAAATMVENIAANAKAIENEAKRADEAEKALGGRIDTLSGVVDTKAAAADLTDLDGRVEAVEGKVSTLEGEMDAVEQKAADNAAAIEALQTASATHATKDELQAVSDIAEAAVTVAEMNEAISAAGHAAQTDLDTHVNNTDIHVTTADKTKWNGAQAAAEATAAANLATARTEITAEIATAKEQAITAAATDAENKVAAEAAIARAAEQANAKAISDEVTARGTAVSGVQTALDTHTNNTDIHVTTADKEKWNAAEQNAKTYSDEKLLESLQWGEF